MLSRRTPITLAALLLSLLATSLAFAGTVERTDLGPGEDPGTFRVRLDVSGETASSCPDHDCAWCCGGYDVDVLPAPVQVLGAYGTPIDGGSRLHFEFGNPETGYMLIDLDVATVYQFSNARVWGAWQKYEPIGYLCTTSDLCTGYDEDFTDFEIVGPGVGEATTAWSALKSRY